MFIDSHCHIDMLTRHESTPISIDALIQEANEAQVDKMLCISVDPALWESMKATCAPYKKRIFLTAGIHPCYVANQDFKLVEQQAADKQVVGIGESGLDYFHCNDEKQKQKQHNSFIAHIDLSAKLNKPIIVHTRDAREDTIAILKSENAERGGGVMHCFTETLDMAKQALDLGFYISFSGIITFKNAQQIRDVCEYVPLDRVLIETDSPYLAPVPYRGKVNRPAWVAHVAETVSQVKGVSTEEIAKITSNNFYSLFPLAKALKS